MNRRSRAWFGRRDLVGIVHRSWMMNQGIPEDLLDGRPVIGICNSWSELTPCNAHLRDLAEEVRRGVLEAGGFPLEFPALSLGESNMRPTAMLFRNLAAMGVEETIRANPLDGVVLLAGCDKTTPALVMGAASCDLPTIVVSGGPMLTGRLRGCAIGSGTALWQFAEDLRDGRIPPDEIAAIEAGMSRSAGHCMTMGTASTMACMMEAMGLSLPYNGSLPAVDAGRRRLARLSGRRIVAMVEEDLRPSRLIQRESLVNAIRTVAAIGGSTNVVIHLLAIAGRLELPLSLDDWDRFGREVPTLVDLQPAGRYLMEDFHYAGGLPAVLRRLDGLGLLEPARTVAGLTLAEQVAEARSWNDAVIRTPDAPLTRSGGLAILRGNLAPDGAVIKPAAASPALMVHRGPAFVFDDIDRYHRVIDDPDLPITPETVLVLRQCGPRGYPGMPEVGNMALPRRLAAAGVRDMVRISDARMSGTAFGTVVLHVSPESAVGGPLALVRTGDLIRLDVPGRKLDMEVEEAELARRRAAWRAPAPPAGSGWVRIYVETVQQAHLGADLDFLVGRRGAAVPRDQH